MPLLPDPLLQLHQLLLEVQQLLVVCAVLSHAFILSGSLAGIVEGNGGTGRYDLIVLGDAPVMAFIPVRDLAAARAFYAETLGLPVTGENSTWWS